MFDVKKCLDESEEKMLSATAYLEDTLAHIRAGKASIHLLDGIKVNSYGAQMSLNQVSAITLPDSRTIAIKPWDKNLFRVIEKAIMDSSLGITPENNGEIIRLSIPPLTEERRKDLTRQCNKEAEQAKISVRNCRRDTIATLKKAVKDGLSEDNEKDAEGEVQKLHDKYMKLIDDVLARKTKEIMTV